jgi:hypothetical protein
MNWDWGGCFRSLRIVFDSSLSLNMVFKLYFVLGSNEGGKVIFNSLSATKPHDFQDEVLVGDFTLIKSTTSIARTVLPHQGAGFEPALWLGYTYFMLPLLPHPAQKTPIG